MRALPALPSSMPSPELSPVPRPLWTTPMPSLMSHPPRFSALLRLSLSLTHLLTRTCTTDAWAGRRLGWVPAGARAALAAHRGPPWPQHDRPGTTNDDPRPRRIPSPATFLPRRIPFRPLHSPPPNPVPALVRSYPIPTTTDQAPASSHPPYTWRSSSPPDPLFRCPRTAR